MAKAIPAARGLVRRVGTALPGFEPDDLTNAYAWANGTDMSVTISLRNCGDREVLLETLAAGVAANGHPKGCGKEEYILYHEVTHIVDYALAATGRFGSVSAASEAVQAQVMALCGLTSSDEDVRTSTCEYATNGPTEWLAEAVAEGLCSSRPRPVAKAALAWVQSVLR